MMVIAKDRSKHPSMWEYVKQRLSLTRIEDADHVQHTGQARLPLSFAVNKIWHVCKILNSDSIKIGQT
jgi:hypothetical protein